MACLTKDTGDLGQGEFGRAFGKNTMATSLVDVMTSKLEGNRKKKLHEKGWVSQGRVNRGVMLRVDG